MTGVSSGVMLYLQCGSGAPPAKAASEQGAARLLHLRHAGRMVCSVCLIGESILNDCAICSTVRLAGAATCSVDAAAASLAGWPEIDSIDDWSCTSALI